MQIFVPYDCGDMSPAYRYVTAAEGLAELGPVSFFSKALVTGDIQTDTGTYASITETFNEVSPFSADVLSVTFSASRDTASYSLSTFTIIFTGMVRVDEAYNELTVRNPYLDYDFLYGQYVSSPWPDVDGRPFPLTLSRCRVYSGNGAGTVYGDIEVSLDYNMTNPCRVSYTLSLTGLWIPE